MTKFLAIINRYEFAQFYRFGYLCISASELLPFAEIDSNETKSNLVSHFKNKTPFEYDEEYLIIQLCQEVENENAIQKFLISDLKAIFPLSRQAKLSIQERIDTRIKLEEPIFESLLPEIISNIQNNEIEMAISALWTIFEFEGSIDLIKQKIGIDYIIKGIELRKKGIKAFQAQNVNIWSILMAYDRYEYFPNTTLGYFFDAGQVFAYSKNANFENSKLFKQLKSIKENSKTDVIIENLNKSDNSQSYISNTNINGLKFNIVAPLYFMLIDDLRKLDDLKKSKYFTQSSLVYLKSFGDEFKAAIILLGSFFGYKKIYDLYYDKLNLSFFKTYKPLITIDNNPQSSIDVVEETVKIEKQDIEATIENPVPEYLKKEENDKSSLIEESKVEQLTNNEIPVIETEKTETQSNEIGIEQEFNFERFVLDLLTQKSPIELTELIDKIKITTKAKKKLTKKDLIDQIVKIKKIELSPQKKPSLAGLRIDLFDRNY